MDKYENRARKLANHCRYCEMPDYRPKCKADYEHQVEEIAEALREADGKLIAERDLSKTIVGQLEAEIAALKESLNAHDDLTIKLRKERDAALAQLTQLRGQIALWP
jgi:predicted nuclease with TOPRIM domain